MGEVKVLDRLRSNRRRVRDEDKLRGLDALLRLYSAKDEEGNPITVEWTGEGDPPEGESMLSTLHRLCPERGQLEGVE